MASGLIGNLTSGTRRLVAFLREHRVPAIIAALSVVLVAEVAIAATHLFYEHRALPRTLVAGMDVGGMTAAEIADRVAREPLPTAIDLTYSGTRVALDPKAMKIQVDAQLTARLAVDAGRSGTPVGNLLRTSAVRSQQIIVGERDALQEFLDSQFAEALNEPVEPDLTFDEGTGAYKLVPGKPGERIAAGDALDAIAARWRPGENMTVPVDAVHAAPLLSDDAAAQAQATANTLLAQDLTLTVGSAKTFVIPKKTVAGFLSFARGDAGVLEPRIIEDAIRDYVAATLRPRLESPAIDDISLTRSGRTVLVIAGLPRTIMTSPDTVVADIAARMRGAKEGPITVEVSETPQGQRTVRDGVRSVDINLTNQTLSLLVDGEALRTYTISSGKPATPTIKGNFAVWHKTELQDMVGGEGPTAYHLVDVRWNSFFSGDYAFHTADWHDDFGTPVSHGCVNMREADAKTAYDFAPIGTKVSVHD